MHAKMNKYATKLPPPHHPTNLCRFSLLFYHHIPFFNRKRCNEIPCAFGTCARGISLVWVKNKMCVAPLPKVEQETSGFGGYPNGAVNVYVLHGNCVSNEVAAGEPSDALISMVGFIFMILSIMVFQLSAFMFHEMYFVYTLASLLLRISLKMPLIG
jgi:hypothetical protein